MGREREHLFIVTYDIADPKRWRVVFRLMKGYGKWVQLSVFQCRLSARRHAEMVQLLDNAIAHASDRVLVVDVGPAEDIEPRFTSLGETFEVMERGPMIV
jgi:CRISPR-associated protein Cas2